jgi:hypothetical protein
MRLNGWQRIGVIASVVWVVAGGLWTRGLIVDDVGKFPSLSHQMCWASIRRAPRWPHFLRREGCVARYRQPLPIWGAWPPLLGESSFDPADEADEAVDEQPCQNQRDECGSSVG